MMHRIEAKMFTEDVRSTDSDCTQSAANPSVYLMRMTLLFLQHSFSVCRNNYKIKSNISKNL